MSRQVYVPRPERLSWKERVALFLCVAFAAAVVAVCLFFLASCALVGSLAVLPVGA